MNISMRILIGVVLLSVGSGILGGIAGIQLYTMHHRMLAQSILRAQRLELTDSKGTPRVMIGLENNGDVVLKMLSSDSKPMVSLGVLAQTKERQEIDEKTGLPNNVYPAPFLQMNNHIGNESISLSTATNGYGLLSFNSETITGKVKLGYWSDNDTPNGIHNVGAWGLVVTGRNAGGLHKYTGVGMEHSDGIDGAYIIPHPAGENP